MLKNLIEIKITNNLVLHFANLTQIKYTKKIKFVKNKIFKLTCVSIDCRTSAMTSCALLDNVI